MNSPEIEYLIASAINNRPKVTNAPMNLYIYDGKLICGARIVMPKDADFVAHVAPHQLENGFGDGEWKLIVERTIEIAGTQELTAGIIPMSTGQNEFHHRIKTDRAKLKEQRREQRLRHRRPVWFGENFGGTLSQGQMVDVSSGAVAFTCRADGNCPQPGRQIATRFSVPRLNPDDSFDAVSFNRIGRICRVDKANDILRRVAVQFAKPLPFKPGEQNISKELPVNPSTALRAGLGAKYVIR